MQLKSAQHVVGKSFIELKKEVVPQQFSFLNTLPLILSPFSQAQMAFSQNDQVTYQAPKTYSYNNLAFFCRLEVKMEKASKMPVRFRLGSVPYVDQLEGKY